MTERPDIAYYYPAPHWGWRDSGWVKSLLLFFDQLAILLPGYMHGRHTEADPSTVIPLEERGLLRVLEPNDWIDQEAAESLTQVTVELLTNGVFDGLAKDVRFHELSQSRIGYGADVGLADMLVEELEAKELALPTEDGVSSPLHPVVRTTILVILAQLSRATGARRDVIVHPSTNNQQAIQDLMQTLSRDSMPSAATVISLDLEPVSFDLTPIPLDEILEFREANRYGHRAYMRDLRRFMVELADIDDEKDREQLLVERREEKTAAIHDLHNSTSRWLGRYGKNLASLSFGLAGAAWTIHGDLDPVSLAFATGSLLPQLLPGHPTPVTAYSYMFDMRQEFGNHTRN